MSWLHETEAWDSLLPPGSIYTMVIAVHTAQSWGLIRLSLLHNTVHVYTGTLHVETDSWTETVKQTCALGEWLIQRKVRSMRMSSAPYSGSRVNIESKEKRKRNLIYVKILLNVDKPRGGSMEMNMDTAHPKDPMSSLYPIYSTGPH